MKEWKYSQKVDILFRCLTQFYGIQLLGLSFFWSNFSEFMMPTPLWRLKSPIQIDLLLQMFPFIRHRLHSRAEYKFAVETLSWPAFSLLPPNHWVMSSTSYWLLSGLVPFSWFALVKSLARPTSITVSNVWHFLLTFIQLSHLLLTSSDKQFLPGPGRSPRLNRVISCKPHNFHRNWHPRRIPILDSPSCSFLRLMVMSWELSNFWAWPGAAQCPFCQNS